MIYYVLLETMSTVFIRANPFFQVSDRKVVEIEAKDLDDAWSKARTRWYEANMGDIQIADIVINKPEPEPMKELEHDQRDQEASGSTESTGGKGTGGNDHDSGNEASGSSSRGS